MVGRINRVSGDSSDILLSVDPRSAIDVITGFGCKPNHVYFDRFVPSGSA